MFGIGDSRWTEKGLSFNVPRWVAVGSSAARTLTLASDYSCLIAKDLPNRRQAIGSHYPLGRHLSISVKRFLPPPPSVVDYGPTTISQEISRNFTWLLS